jgi:hypothetical protein
VLSGAWLGHAVHPILSDIPIGAWTSAVLLDWTGGKESRSAADQLILTGVLAAGATAATGWSDWANAERGNAAVRRSGLAHAAANGRQSRSWSAPTWRASEARADEAGCSRSPARLRWAPAAGWAGT